MLLVFLLALFALPAAGGEAEVAKPALTLHATLRSASEAAAADQSLVLLIFGAEWCGPCKKLKSETLASPEFSKGAGVLHLTEVDIDAESKMARDFEIQAVPTLILLAGDSKIVSRTEGFLTTTNLLSWIAQGRERVKQGKWEGTAPGSKISEFVTKAAGDGLSAADVARLIAMLGEPDPAERAEAGKLILAQREQAVLPLIEAAKNDYLGTRIAAGELLHQLAPNALTVDPWQSPAEMLDTIAALKKWWAETGKLPAHGPATETAAPAEGSIKAALDALRGDDPVKRTDAMSTLTSQGNAALPAVREALKRSERTGDHRTLTLLEDVRWAILVPDTVERRAGGVRNVLARGKGQERQVAAAKLGRAGRDAIPALSELVNDADSLVVESAVRALSSIGGPDAIPAMAALLKASDSNLRMTAAQALGHTKNEEAISHLLTVLGDPNEIVACTALAALEEIKSVSGIRISAGGATPEVVGGIKKCLQDARWRVRAAAAEVAGKLRLSELGADLKKLLDDADSFVVKSALTALEGIGTAPDGDQLVALSKRLPSLKNETIKLMLQSESDETVRSISGMYDAGGNDEKLAILEAITVNTSNDQNKPDTGWKPLIAKAITSTDARQRRAAATFLSRRSPKLAAEMISPLLADHDPQTRTEAAQVVLALIANKRVMSLPHGGSMFVGGDFFPGGSQAANTNKAPLVTSERRSAWHAALEKNAGSTTDIPVAAALFATGDGKPDLPLLTAAFEKADTKILKTLNQSAAIEVVIHRLPWPEGQAMLDKLCRTPAIFAMAAAEAEQAPAGIADYLLEPARFKAAVEPATGEDLQAAINFILGSGGRSWSLVAESPRTTPVAMALLASTNAAWRAAAVYALGQRDPEKNLQRFQNAGSDPNSWVRAAAIQSMTKAISDRHALEEHLGKFVDDDNMHVAQTAAMALLESEVRQAAGLEWEFEYFHFDNVMAGRSSTVTMNEERPLTALEGHPAFLAAARQKMSLATNAFDQVAFALLLSQYGDPTGLERLVGQSARPEKENEMSLTDPLLTAVALIHDPKYLPFVRKTMEAQKNDWELRKILKALKGMNGAEARQLRLEVNKRIRSSGGASGMMVD